MPSVSDALAQFVPARFLFLAIAVSLSGIGLLLLFIIVRRWVRNRYFGRRDLLCSELRRDWDRIIRGDDMDSWRTDALAREVLESILLDRIEVAQPNELPALFDCLRRCGILDRRIRDAR